MQTFLPYPNIRPSVASLTDDQLCRQRVDAKKILSTLEGKSKTHRHHPAVKMWNGYDELLKGYLAGSIYEWISRGHSNNMEIPKFDSFKFKLPLWWGGYIHRTHKSLLIRLNPHHCKDFDWNIGYDIPLFWPVRHNGKFK